MNILVFIRNHVLGLIRIGLCTCYFTSSLHNSIYECIYFNFVDVVKEAVLLSENLTFVSSKKETETQERKGSKSSRLKF